MTSRSCTAFRHAIALAAILVPAVASHAATIYKYRLPDGSVLYSQKPVPRQQAAKVIRVAPPSAKQLQTQRAAERQLARLQQKSTRLAKERLAQQEADNRTQLVAMASERAADAYRPPLAAVDTATGVVAAAPRLSEADWQRIRAQMEADYQLREQYAQVQARGR